MTNALKKFGEYDSVAATPFDLYTVPAGKSASVSSVFICNRSSSNTIKFRVWHAIGGAATNNAQYKYYDMPLRPNDTYVITSGISMGSLDVLRVQADQTGVSFNAEGAEVS